MAARNFSNNAVETALTGDINASTTSIPVGSQTGWPPAPFTGLFDPDTVNEEAFLCTAVGGLTLTVVRGYNGTTGLSHSTGAVVKHAAVAMDFTEANQHNNATSNVHGVTGALAGVTDTQTLTNKTMSGAANTFTNIPYTAITGVPAQDVVVLTKTASYQPVAADDNALIVCDHATVAIVITIPPDATAPSVGGSVSVFRKGAAGVSIAAGSGVTLLYTPGLTLRAVNSFATALKIAANTWLVTGDLS